MYAFYASILMSFDTHIHIHAYTFVHTCTHTYVYMHTYICIYAYILEKEMATHSSVLAWRIPGTGEPDGLPSTGSHRVGDD